MEWYEKIIKEHKKKILSSFTIAIVFYITHAIWTKFTGASYTWTEIDPISQPNILYYRLYSGIAFVTVGAFLFHKFKLWKFIYSISGNRREYRKNKKDLWTIIVLVTFGLVYLAIKMLNATISIIYNIWNLIIYLLPPLGITVSIILIIVLLLKTLRTSTNYSSITKW